MLLRRQGMNVNIKGCCLWARKNLGPLDARDPEKIARGMPLNFLPEPEEMTGSYAGFLANNHPLTKAD